MAVEFTGSTVNRKYWLFVVMTALFLCASVLLLLMFRINDARSNFAQTNPGAYNYLLQSNRNLDAYIDALRESRVIADSIAAKQEQRELYLERFEIVWGGFTVFEINFKFESEQQQVKELVEYSMNYLTENEHLMVPDYELSDAEVSRLITGARSISEKIVHIGHKYFVYASQQSDLWNEKLRKLSHLFWICSILLVLTVALLLSMLLRSVRRSAELIEKSHNSQREMKRLIDELRSGKLENKAKDSFIAAASHDLRQPLHALGLFLGATEKHIANEAGLNALTEAKHCTAELNRLFNSLLDLSRLDAGVVQANKAQFKLDRLLRPIDQEFSALAKQKGVRFDVCQELHYVNTDALLLNRILRNLLENAFSHSAASNISIFCKRNGATLKLTVSDDGVGIPVAEQSDIFSEYYQLNNPDRDRSKGLGLGLSIVKRLCEISDIVVSMESSIGQGTMFHLEIRAGDLILPLSHESSVTSFESTDVPDGTLVAVIDDNVNVRKGMESILESMNIKVISAESAIYLIRKLRFCKLTPHIIVADYRLLNNQTGDRAIHQVRSEFGISIPAMIITGDTSPSRMNELASCGFELMHKPVEPIEFLRRVSRLVRSVNLPEVELS